MNRKKVLIAAASALVALGVLMALLLPSGGNVQSAKHIAHATDLYTKEDIEAAFDAIESEFVSGFKGCTLKELRYDDEIEAQYLDETPEHKQKGTGDLIVVLSEFTTDWRAADEGFSPNERYEGWQWILTRPSQGAPWKVVDWGY